MDTFTFDRSKMKLIDKLASNSSGQRIHVILDDVKEMSSANLDLSDSIEKRMEVIDNELSKVNLTTDNLVKLNVFLAVEEDEVMVENIIKANLVKHKFLPTITILKTTLPNRDKVKIEAIVTT